MSHGTSPLAWARESRLLADNVMRASRQTGASADYLSRLQADCRRHIARSTANQFVWTRLRGASRAQAWRWAAGCLSYLSWSRTAWSRLLAALLLPRALLRRLLLNAATRMAETRRKGDSKNSREGAVFDT